MQNKVTHFPVYKKLSNGRVYYKILDDRNFEEKQKLGTQILYFSMEAKQYPDILRIQDMLDVENESFIEISSEEYEEF